MGHLLINLNILTDFIEFFSGENSVWFLILKTVNAGNIYFVVTVLFADLSGLRNYIFWKTASTDFQVKINFLKTQQY